MDGDALIECRSVSLRFGQTAALDDVTLQVRAGEVMAVTGPSGCGKSTLLHVMSGLLRPDSGTVAFRGETISELSDSARSHHRLRSFGFVLQFGDLVPELTLIENVELPLRLTQVKAREARRRATEIMAELDIAQVADRLTVQVSGGQAQRAAVARALVHRPAVVFADEPTGALDSTSGQRVLGCLLEAARARGTAVLLVTHAHDVARHADRLIAMRDGRIAAEDPNVAAVPADGVGLRGF
jgi:putative ABC transport system ATP-binding protein